MPQFLRQQASGIITEKKLPARSLAVNYHEGVWFATNLATSNNSPNHPASFQDLLCRETTGEEISAGWDGVLMLVDYRAS